MSHDERIYSSFARLSLLAKVGRKLSWQPPYSNMSPLSGVQKSHQRGRGLDFVELRHYFEGDDVRCIDWRVTQRTGQAFIRLYAEEKDKNAMLIIDLRSTMFFASDGAMKSALASEVAAIIAGRIQAEGDRIGALIITDASIEVHLPQRGGKSLSNLLDQIVMLGQQLPTNNNHSLISLDDVLKHLCQQKIKDSQIFIISDFIDFTAGNSNQFINRLAKHNNVIGLRISDPLEETLPESSLLMGDGKLQLAIDANKSRLRERYNASVSNQTQQIEDCFNANSQPCIHLCTHQDSWQQLIELSVKGAH